MTLHIYIMASRKVLRFTTIFKGSLLRWIQDSRSAWQYNSTQRDLYPTLPHTYTVTHSAPASHTAISWTPSRYCIAKYCKHSRASTHIGTNICVLRHTTHGGIEYYPESCSESTRIPLSTIPKVREVHYASSHPISHTYLILTYISQRSVLNGTARPASLSYYYTCSQYTCTWNNGRWVHSIRKSNREQVVSSTPLLTGTTLKQYNSVTYRKGPTSHTLLYILTNQYSTFRTQ